MPVIFTGNGSCIVYTSNFDRQNQLFGKQKCKQTEILPMEATGMHQYKGITLVLPVVLHNQ